MVTNLYFHKEFNEYHLDYITGFKIIILRDSFKSYIDMLNYLNTLQIKNGVTINIHRL